MTSEAHQFDELLTIITDPGRLIDKFEEPFKADLKARFDSLPPERQLVLTRQAYKRHNYAARRKIKAMTAERERLQKEIDDLHNNMSDDQVIATHFLVHGPGQDRTNGFVRVVMQRIQLEVDAAELEARQPYVESEEEEEEEEAEVPKLRPNKGYGDSKV